MKATKFKDLVRVFVKGGIISPGDLLKIVHVAEKLGTSYVHFGSRQDILFPVRQINRELLDKTFAAIHTDYEIGEITHHNIASSYVSLDLQPNKVWLASHIYHYIIDSFDYQPTLRINIVDPSQSLVPLFTGNINFLASNQDNYWYVYLRFKEILPTPWQLPFLVYGDDIAKLSGSVEDMEVVNKKLTYQQVLQRLEEMNLKTQPVTEDLVLPPTNFPYYEGINRMSENKYWLGLYWRDNKFNTGILKEICKRCIATEVGKISLTPWKSFVIKGIFEKDRVGWEKLMGKFGMNLRHSALELNWHIPALDEEALALKTQLVRMLDQQDISTYGLTFTVKTNNDITPFTSIVIEKSAKNSELYNILYSKDFNANLNEYFTYAKNVAVDAIATLLVELSRLYYEHLGEGNNAKKESESEDKPGTQLYQCENCLTIYDARYGDPSQGIAANTAFKELPDDYECPLCGADKRSFKEVVSLV